MTDGPDGLRMLMDATSSDLIGRLSMVMVRLLTNRLEAARTDGPRHLMTLAVREKHALGAADAQGESLARD